MALKDCKNALLDHIKCSNQKLNGTLCIFWFLATFDPQKNTSNYPKMTFLKNEPWEVLSGLTKASTSVVPRKIH